MRPFAQLPKRYDGDIALVENSGNKLVAGVAPQGLALRDGQNFRMGHMIADRARSVGEEFRLTWIASERHGVHEAACAVAMVGKIDAHWIARGSELLDAHAALHEAQNFFGAEIIGGPGAHVA